MISDKAVEAATTMFPWQAADYLDTDTVRAALEAAAPYMPSPDAASVWADAANVLYMGNAIDQDHLKAMLERNPHRSRA